MRLFPGGLNSDNVAEGLVGSRDLGGGWGSWPSEFVLASAPITIDSLRHCAVSPYQPDRCLLGLDAAAGTSPRLDCWFSLRALWIASDTVRGKIAVAAWSLGHERVSRASRHDPSRLHYCCSDYERSEARTGFRCPLLAACGCRSTQ